MFEQVAFTSLDFPSSLWTWIDLNEEAFSPARSLSWNTAWTSTNVRLSFFLLSSLNFFLSLLVSRRCPLAKLSTPYRPGDLGLVPPLRELWIDLFVRCTKRKNKRRSFLISMMMSLVKRHRWSTNASRSASETTENTSLPTNSSTNGQSIGVQYRIRVDLFDISFSFVMVNINDDELSPMGIWQPKARNRLGTRLISFFLSCPTMFSSIHWHILTVKNRSISAEAVRSIVLVTRTRETATIVYQQLKSMKKIDLDYFSVDTDFREQNLLVSFLLEGNWRALRRDYFRLPKRSLRTTFEIVVAHRNIIAHCIELLTRIQPDKSIAFNASVTVRKTDVPSTDTLVLV